MSGRGGVLLTSYHVLSNRGAHPRWSYSSANAHLAQLEEHLRQAAAGHGRVVLVGGEAGVGKTSLVDGFSPADRPRQRCCGPRATRSPRRVRSVPCATWRRRSVCRSTQLALDGDAREPALSGGAGGLRRAAGADGHHRRGRALGRRRLARAVPLPRPADWRAPRPLRRHLPRRRDRGRSPPPSGPGRSGHRASRPSRLSLRPLSEEAVSDWPHGSGRDAASPLPADRGQPVLPDRGACHRGRDRTDHGRRCGPGPGGPALARGAGGPRRRGGDRLDDRRQTSCWPLPVRSSTKSTSALPVACCERTDDGLTFRHELTREAILAAIAPLRRRAAPRPRPGRAARRARGRARPGAAGAPRRGGGGPGGGAGVRHRRRRTGRRAARPPRGRGPVRPRPPLRRRACPPPSAPACSRDDRSPAT